VQKIHLLKLIGDVSSWAELESRIISLPTEIERGEAFEQFCKVYFLLNPYSKQIRFTGRMKFLIL